MSHAWAVWMVPRVRPVKSWTYASSTLPPPREGTAAPGLGNQLLIWDQEIIRLQPPTLVVKDQGSEKPMKSGTLASEPIKVPGLNGQRGGGENSQGVQVCGTPQPGARRPQGQPSGEAGRAMTHTCSQGVLPPCPTRGNWSRTETQPKSQGCGSLVFGVCDADQKVGIV